ncbi:MAG TPA: basic amino acid ABC transporter substrate-binding protein [Bacillales bacterium]|nr:basic amino acid ABC transporter substrate-binding protein [Bacillales bacterium]
MKKAMLLLFTMVIMFALSACGAGNQNGSKSGGNASGNSGEGQAESGTVINVGTNPTFPPFETTTNDGDLAGFDIALLKAIANQENLEVHFRSMQFDGLIPALQGGTIDAAIAGMTITKDRLKHVAFSNAYYKSGLSIMTKPGSDIHSFSDLKGHLVATQKATSSVTYMKNHGIPASDIKQYSSISAAYSSLLSGGADAVLYDNPVNVNFLKGHKDKAKIVGKLLTGEYYGIAVSKKSADLVQKLNEGLKKLKQNGGYKKLFDEYLNGDTRGLVKDVVKPKKAAVQS